MFHWRFSLRGLLLVVMSIALLLGAATWHPALACLPTPLLIGAWMAHRTQPSRGSAAAGIFAAYYWVIALAWPGAMLAYVLAFVGIDMALTLWLCTVLVSILGGYLGARMERSRMKDIVERA